MFGKAGQILQDSKPQRLSETEKTCQWLDGQNREWQRVVVTETIWNLFDSSFEEKSELWVLTRLGVAICTGRGEAKGMIELV